MTFTFTHKTTQEIVVVTARCDAHAWGKLKCGRNPHEFELAGASQFGRRLWGVG